MNHLNKFQTNENRKPFTAPKSMKRPIYSQMNLYITNKLAKYEFRFNSESQFQIDFLIASNSST